MGNLGQIEMLPRLLLAFTLRLCCALADGEDCQPCLQNNADAISTGDTVAAWCFPTGQCMQLSSLPDVLNLLSCPNYDFTFIADACVCRPNVYTTCAQCANAEHLGCIWMANATVTNTFTYSFGRTNPKVHTYPSTPSSFFWEHGQCVQGSGFSPFGLSNVYNYSGTVLPLSISFSNFIKPGPWYWGQCNVTGAGMAVIAIAVSVLGCCLC